MPDPIDPKTLDALATSIADHSYLKHGHEFRNEKLDGSPRPTSPRKSYGESFAIHNKDDLAQHIKETIQSPDTKYFINPADGGRTVFFNEKTGTTVIFNPHQLAEGDGHAGTVLREKVAERGALFNSELDSTKTRLGQAPDVRYADDGKWLLSADAFKTPTARSAAYALDKPPLPPAAKLPDVILDANKLDVVEGIREISKLAKAGRLGANVTGVGIVIGAASLVLMENAHAAQRDFAGDLQKANVLDDDAYQSYIELNNNTENLLYGDLAISTADPTGLSIVITLGAEGKARSDFKDWADEHAPNLSEAQFQALSMSIFSGNSARGDMLWDARGQLPISTAGQPEYLHKAIGLNSLYNEARQISYSHKAGYVYSGNLSQTLSKTQAMGIDVVEERISPHKTIQNLREAIKQELVQELDTQLSNPKTIDAMLGNIPADDRLEYVRRLAASEGSLEHLEKLHPEVSAYLKAYDKSLTGWGWTMDEDDVLLSNPDLLNAYIKDRTLLPSSDAVAAEVFGLQKVFNAATSIGMPEENILNSAVIGFDHMDDPDYLEAAISLEKLHAGESLDNVEIERLKQIISHPDTDGRVVSALQDRYGHEAVDQYSDDKTAKPMEAVIEEPRFLPVKSESTSIISTMTQ